MSLTVYGIPTCGTCRKARTWLDARGADYTWIDLRAQPPEPERLDTWIEAFGARALRNTSGGAYRALPDAKKTWDDAQWRAAFAADAMLIKRPVIERDGRPVLVGFRRDDDELERLLL